MLNDELEPMRRAAELGCEDFYTLGTLNPLAVGMRMMSPESDRWVLVGLPYRDERSPINRYAADVCECWWRQQEIEHVTQRNDVLRMIDLCRAFRRKYGV